MLPAYSHSGPLETIEPDDVVDGLVIGRDPAPFIREELRRHGAGGVG